MIKQTEWFERTFHFDSPVGTFPCLLERLRGAPPRIEEIVGSLPADILTRKVDGGWSIQEHAGHLLDLEALGVQRLNDFRSRASVLTPADLSNRKTHEANHNAASIRDILGQFRNSRSALVGQLELFDETEVTFSALHPRLNIPMRVVDWCTFMAEHDDHHLARMAGLAKQIRQRA